MSSYSVDLAAIFSSAYEPIDGDTEPGSENGGFNVSSTGDPTLAAAAEAAPSQLSSVGSSGAVCECSGSSVSGPTPSICNETSFSRQQQPAQPSPRINLTVNPLNSMANSIVEAFKRTSPGSSPPGAFTTFAATSSSGETTTLKYTPLIFDDDEQLPICAHNLNANNNNSNIIRNNNHSPSASLTTAYGAADEADGWPAGGRRRGVFRDRVSVRGPFSMTGVCIAFLVFFIGVISFASIVHSSQRKPKLESVPLHQHAHRHHKHHPRAKSAAKASIETHPPPKPSFVRRADTLLDASEKIAAAERLLGNLSESDELLVLTRLRLFYERKLEEVETRLSKMLRERNGHGDESGVSQKSDRSAGPAPESDHHDDKHEKTAAKSHADQVTVHVENKSRSGSPSGTHPREKTGALSGSGVVAAAKDESAVPKPLYVQTRTPLARRTY